MEWIVWLVIMAPCSALMTGIGIFAWKRKEPMWFWSGSTVKAEAITNVPAYNRANGRMWIVFSLPFWLSTVLGCFSPAAGGILVAVACILGIPALVFAYRNIYEQYSRKE